MTTPTVAMFVTGFALLAPGAGGPAAGQPRAATAIVADILRADYEANLPALMRLYDELVPPSGTERDASRIRYWRGFARWRRAINGVNDGAPVPQMMEDLQAASREFDAALGIDPQFVDARAGLLSSLGIQLFLLGGDMTKMQPLLDRARPLVGELKSGAPDHPRVLWVLGQVEWRTPPDWPRDRVVERQDRVMASYARGLEVIRASNDPGADSLEPRWGEPELLMNLAWSSLNKAVPDAAAAERYARQALALVPHWHYVRDILLPQIAKARQAGGEPSPAE
jgi:hypothetical protein